MKKDLLNLKKKHHELMEHLNLIRKIVWSFHNTTGLDWDDLFQEACLGYLETMDRYDPRKGKITTHMWHCVSTALVTYLNKENKYRSICDPFGIVVEKTTNPSYLFESLTYRGQIVLQLIIDSLENLILLSPADARKNVRTMLFKKGWTLEEVRQGIKECKTIYS